MNFPFIRQNDEMDCGAVCLQMIARYYGQYFPIEELRENCYTNESGTSLYAISEAAEGYGLKTSGFKCDINALINEAPLPVIALWNENHYVVVYKATKRSIHVADPAIGKVKYNHREFLQGFMATDQEDGVILSLEPTDAFYQQQSQKETKANAWKYLWSHLSGYKIFLYQVLIAAFVTSLLTLLLPIITQSLIDDGVVNGNYYFIKVLLISQLLIFLGKLSFDVLKNWIIIHWSFRINISVISGFLKDFLGLSAQQLSKKTSADVLQRVDDYQNVEEFLANTSISLVLSSITFIFFSLLLWFYNFGIFFVFSIGTLLSIFWIVLFQAKRKRVFYKLVGLMTQNKFKVINIVEGLDEIKMFNLERKKRWEWEDIQVKEYESNVSNLKIEQTQEVGFQAINELKNIAIIFIGALAVMNGEITLGALLAIAFISGQLNNSLSFIPGVFQIGQEARISLERLMAVSKPESDKQAHGPHKIIPGDIQLKNISFTYDGYSHVLSNISFDIPKGSTVAIVGASGSGKTTLLKLLTKFAHPAKGSITVDGVSLNQLNDADWRKKLGVVSQEGYIFPDTVLKNIAISSTVPSIKRTIVCAKIANIHTDINDLPNGYYTKIGDEGHIMSKGQNQRILIARAIYENPEYLFFDEATSALDTVNEKLIQENLNKVFKNKTVLIIAHRLSTVQNADKVIVLRNGKMVETGDHETLVKQKGYYFDLVKDQLNLGQ